MIVASAPSVLSIRIALFDAETGPYVPGNTRIVIPFGTADTAACKCPPTVNVDNLGVSAK